MKKLLILLCILSCTIVTACAPAAQQQQQPKKEMAFQMYSVRDLIGDPDKFAQNQADVLKRLAEMGYTAVEAACYDNGKLYGMEPEEFKAAIEAAGLKVLSSHTTRNLSDEEIQNRDFTEALKWWDQCIDAHKRAGCSYIVIPWCNVPPTLEALQVICEFYSEVGSRVNAAGMKLGYHNHSHEYQKVEDKVMLEYMLENTDPAKLFFEMDVYWTVRGQVAPVEMFKKYPGRFTLLHIKDDSEIGQSGMVGFDAIFNNAETAGLKGWIVELEHASTPDIMAGMKMSADYLLNAAFVKESYE
ncbi:MAG: sugar phosphate isomerase/epimerase [Prevotellaceae bacterium]|nr:sugar phosphate isomerase/epimerase [Prevotellaceae bacterium]MDY6099595.1 sugar phosphate isomerase/epimerase [Bacteroidaceae bacterium]